MTENTTLDPVTGTWNEGLAGDILWSRNNFGEGRPDVMAPITFSITDAVWRKISLLPGYSLAGNICGRGGQLITVDGAAGLVTRSAGPP